MMDYPVLAGCGLTRSDAAKVLPLVLLVCQRGCKRSANLLQYLSHYTNIWSFFDTSDIILSENEDLFLKITNFLEQMHNGLE